MSEKGGASNNFRDREGGLRSKKDDKSMLSPEESRCDVQDEGESSTPMARPAPPSSVTMPTVWMWSLGGQVLG